MYSFFCISTFVLFVFVYTGNGSAGSRWQSLGKYIFNCILNVGLFVFAQFSFSYCFVFFVFVYLCSVPAQGVNYWLTGSWWVKGSFSKLIWIAFCLSGYIFTLVFLYFYICIFVLVYLCTLGVNYWWTGSRWVRGSFSKPVAPESECISIIVTNNILHNSSSSSSSS